MSPLLPTLALALQLAGAPPAEAELPPGPKAMLLLRVLGYDRALGRRCGEEVVVGVAWRPGEEQARDDLLASLRRAAERFSLAGRRVRAVPLRLERDRASPEAREAGACAVLFAGPLAPGEAAALGRALAAGGLVAAGGERADVEHGLALGLVLRGDRAAVLVNVAAARAAGADLDSALFTVAERVGAAR